MKINALSKNTFIAVKVTVSFLSFGYIAYIFLQSPDFYIDFIRIWSDFSVFSNAESLYLAVLLVPINWGLEAYKWQFLAKKIDYLSFSESLKGVLSGLTLGFITPHAVGDYVARIYFMKVKHSLRAIGAVLLARIAQFYITLFCGVLGFIQVFKFTELHSGFFNMEVLMPVCLLFILIFIGIFNYRYLSLSLTKILFFRRYIHPYLKVIGYYQAQELYYLFFFAFLRFGIFTAQYLLVLQFFEVNVYNILIVSSIWLIFLAKSAFPSFNFLNDVGIREAAALFFLGNLGLENEIIISASLTVWFLNILIPSFIGILIIDFQDNKTKY